MANAPVRRARPLPPPKEWEYVRVADSGVHGRGLFAALFIPKGSCVMEYRGEKVTKAEGRRRTNTQWAEGRMYMFDLNRRFDIDGSPQWNLARLANYSCEPNTESENEDGKRIWIKAMKDIPAGDEITYDYNFDFVDPPPECHCGAAHCRGYIVGKAQIPRLRAWLKRHGLPIPAGARPKPRKTSTKTAPRKATANKVPQKTGKKAAPIPKAKPKNKPSRPKKK